MAGHKSINVLRAKISPERRERINAQVQDDLAEMILAEIRKQEGITQAELAERMGVRQSTVSQLEGQDDMFISTLRRLVEAIGGELEINIKIRDTRYRLASLSKAAG